jgi:hypothetical protein
LFLIAPFLLFLLFLLSENIYLQMMKSEDHPAPRRDLPFKAMADRKIPTNYQDLDTRYPRSYTPHD